MDQNNFCIHYKQKCLGLLCSRSSDYKNCKDSRDISEIPEGMYCYTMIDTNIEENIIKLKVKNCPYWSLNLDKPDQMNGYCSLLEKGDWDVEIPDDFPEGFPLSCLSLLWEQIKECGIKDNIDEKEDNEYD